jgi:hypothetical protein
MVLYQEVIENQPATTSSPTQPLPLAHISGPLASPLLPALLAPFIKQKLNLPTTEIQTSSKTTLKAEKKMGTPT